MKLPIGRRKKKDSCQAFICRGKAGEIPGTLYVSPGTSPIFLYGGKHFSLNIDKTNISHANTDCISYVWLRCFLFYGNFQHWTDNTVDSL